MTEEELSRIETQADLQEYRRERAASWLASVLPQSLVDRMVAGSQDVALACAQVPDPEQRRLGLVSTFLYKAGPDGSALGKARRALEELVLFQPTGHLPASPILLNRLIVHCDQKARAAGRGSQGGATVAASIRSGLITLHALGFPIPAGHISVDAGAPPARKALRQRRAGSLPLCFYMHFECLAASPEDTFARFYARSLVLCWLFSSLRMVDVLRTTVAMADPDADGTPVVFVLTSFSKDGAPLDVYLRAEGFLGPFLWVAEHVASLAGRPFVLPAFTAPRGHTGDILHATAWVVKPRMRVASVAHVQTSLRSLAAQAPLCFTDADWQSFAAAGHSAHGSPSDIGASIGPHAEPQFAFFAVDEQELGHWRRRATSSTDREMELEPGLSAALDRHRRPVAQAGEARPMPAAAPAAMSAEDASMRVRYTQGANRHGRRTAQIRVRRRLVAAVREALRRYARPWESLISLARSSSTDYSILALLVPSER